MVENSITDIIINMHGYVMMVYFLNNQILQDSLSPALSNGIVMVSTILGPQ